MATIHNVRCGAMENHEPHNWGIKDGLHCDGQIVTSTPAMSETGRKFVVDDNNGEFLRSAPDHDEWALWTEWVDNVDHSLWYVSDHEGYTMSAEEFGPLPYFPTYGPYARPLMDVLNEYMDSIEPGAGRSVLTGEECC